MADTSQSAPELQQALSGYLVVEPGSEGTRLVEMMADGTVCGSQIWIIIQSYTYGTSSDKIMDFSADTTISKPYSLTNTMQ
jgi:hypothetical protein